jgi:hypothetical protein
MMSNWIFDRQNNFEVKNEKDEGNSADNVMAINIVPSNQPRIIFPKRSMTASLGIKNPVISKTGFSRNVC